MAVYKGFIIFNIKPFYRFTSGDKYGIIQAVILILRDDKLNMERIDKIISKHTYYSRKEIKKLISQKAVTANGEVVKKPESKYDGNNVSIKINGEEIEIKKHIYLLLNKPKGYISATETKSEKTVLDLVPIKYKYRDLFPAGRLDKDTTGLMLITDDGEFAHNILSPRKHVEKEYEVTLDIPVTSTMAEGFKSGVNLNDGECKTANLEITGEYSAKVTITEGRYHQIKRMFGCFGAKVLELNRIRIGNLYLPKELKLGEIKEATDAELQKIQERN